MVDAACFAVASFNSDSGRPAMTASTRSWSACGVAARGQPTEGSE